MNAAAPARYFQPSRARAEHGAGAEPARASLTLGPFAAILTVFWTYVALSNILYARSMSFSLDPGGKHHFFAAWDARALQHLFLYPVLLGCVWLALRIGWRPAARAITLQVLLGLAFSVLAYPFLHVGEQIQGTGLHGEGDPGMGSSSWLMLDKGDFSTWVASTTSFLLTYGFALALVMGFALFRRFRESELRRIALEHAWSDARLAALRMQLSPHTLFNLLHTIRGQIGWDPPAAQQMLVQLGDLLRRLLAAGERDLSPLADEIEFVRLYLELQRQRFSDRLALDLPAAYALPHTWVPSLILQPLVENAVAHGLADHTGPVVIRVAGAISGGMLSLRVTNTMTADRGAGDRGRGGIGLRNVRERLAVHFGDRAVLEAGPTAGIEGADWLWVAEIRMPLLGETGRWT